METPDDQPTDRADDPDEEDLDEPVLGEFPAGVGAEIYPQHLAYLRRHEAFGEAVLSFPDEGGGHHDVSLDDVTATEEPDGGPDEGHGRTKILLRNGVIVLASGAVIAAAIATARYRRKHK